MLRAAARWRIWRAPPALRWRNCALRAWHVAAGARMRAGARGSADGGVQQTMAAGGIINRHVMATRKQRGGNRKQNNYRRQNNGGNATVARQRRMAST